MERFNSATRFYVRAPSLARCGEPKPISQSGHQQGVNYAAVRLCTSPYIGVRWRRIEERMTGIGRRRAQPHRTAYGAVVAGALFGARRPMPGGCPATCKRHRCIRCPGRRKRRAHPLRRGRITKCWDGRLDHGRPLPGDRGSSQRPLQHAGGSRQIGQGARDRLSIRADRPGKVPDRPRHGRAGGSHPLFLPAASRRTAGKAGGRYRPDKPREVP